MDSSTSTATLLEQLFAGTEGYALSSQGRSRLGCDADPAFTYGEVSLDAMRQMLDSVEPQAGEVFYDLGSGTGKGVIYASLLYAFARATGIELLEELYNAADAIRMRYEEARQQHGRNTQVDFRLGDIFTEDISDGNIVFSHCTCFDDILMNRLATKLETLKPGSRVITVTKNLTSPEFELLGSMPVTMAWGQATAWMHRRK
jgi:SAM-dependent methyltransferase